MRRNLAKAIELIFRVQVLSGEAHLLQYDLDRDRSAVVVLGESARVRRVMGEHLSNFGRHVPRHLQ
jgi:hypothetical protein